MLGVGGLLWGLQKRMNWFHKFLATHYSIPKITCSFNANKISYIFTHLYQKDITYIDQNKVQNQPGDRNL